MVQLDKIHGISVGAAGDAKATLVGLVRESAAVAGKLIVGHQSLTTRALGMALTAAIQSVNALITAANAQCDLAPPPADIEMRPGKDGGLILRCYHTPPHEWKLDGSPLP